MLLFFPALFWLESGGLNLVISCLNRTINFRMQPNHKVIIIESFVFSTFRQGCPEIGQYHWTGEVEACRSPLLHNSDNMRGPRQVNKV